MRINRHIASAVLPAALGFVSGLACDTLAEPEPTVGTTSANGGGGQAVCLPEVVGTVASPTQPIAGVIHREGEVDAINLSLETDGSARLAIFGCDFCRVSGMQWQEDGDDVLLVPLDGGGTLSWLDDVGVDDTVTEVRLSRRPDGQIDADVTSALSTYAQLWLDDRVCAKCCSGLGPSGLFLCELPLPLDACDQKVNWSCDTDCAI